MKSLIFFATLSVCLFFGSFFVQAQETCQPPPIILNNNANNIFTEQQEMDLGDAMSERAQKDYRVIDDAEVNGYLQQIGDRLIRHLPRTNIKFRFVVVDLPEANAYASAGGRIYVTRKLISFARSEDELAGVIAHELGHGVVRHSAIDLSKLFKEILGVTKLGDRRDVFDKYNQLIEKRRTKIVRTTVSHEDGQQLEADRIGMFALIAAGYDANLYTAFWSRFTESKKRSAVFQFFITPKPAEKRLSEMISIMKKLPPQCLEKRFDDNGGFEKWRSAVITYSGLGGKERLKGVVFRKNLTPLRSEVKHFSFSPNGEYVLAQDESGVNVLKREPFSFHFRIEAPDYKPAHFSPDSKKIILSNSSRRVQIWNVTEKNLSSAHEIGGVRPCWQSTVSPDGKILACFENYSFDLILFDTATGDTIFKEKEFYVPGYFEYHLWELFMSFRGDDELRIVNMQFSPDGRYFVAGAKGRGSIGVDLQTKKEIALGDNVKKLLFTAYTFYAPDKIIGQYGSDEEKSGIFAFPSGERIEQFMLRGETFSKAQNGDYLMVRPTQKTPVGVYDLKTKKFILANKNSALDVFGEYFVSERKDGELGLYKLPQGETVGLVNLSQSLLGNLRAAMLSPDRKWLAVSEKSRGAIWNLVTGERAVHIRGFRGVHFADDGTVHADFPKDESMARTMAAMNPKDGSATPTNPITEKNTRQHGRFLLSFKSEAEKPKEEKPKKDEKNKDVDFNEEQMRVGFSKVSLEIRDAQSNNLLWARRFGEERPSYSFNVLHNTLTLIWRLKSKAAKTIIKTDATLSSRLSAMEEKEGDYFVQVLDPQTGQIKQQLMIETGEGSFEIEDVYAADDWLVVSDSENRVLLYSLSQNALRHRFFGEKPIISTNANLLATENMPGQVTVYSLLDGEEREKLYFGKPVSFAQFNPDGSRLFVLTANQTAFWLDTTVFGAQKAQASTK